MDQGQTMGIDRGQYLLLVAVLCAAVLIGGAAYAGWSSARTNAGKLGNASSGTFPGSMADGALQQGSGAGAALQQDGVATLAGNGTNGSQGAAGATGQKNSSGALKMSKEVTIDMLYLDTCPHCQAMKPIVASVAAKLPPDRFEVRYWNYATRGGADTAAIFSAYSDAGYFQGYVPTFVANGNDSRVGEMSEMDFRSWVCTKFSSPKPDYCA